MAEKENRDMDNIATQLPGDEVPLSSEIEKIREKTFDSEFKELVSRVTAHRPDGESLREEAEKNLLERYQRLFYRAANLYWLEDIHPKADPFLFDNAALGDSLSLHIYSEMDNLGLRSFAIMTYDFIKKSFACSLNHITQYNRDNLVLDIDEQLFRRIMKTRRGVVVDAADIERDLFLKKRFVAENTGTVPGVLYFLSLDFLEEELFSRAGDAAPPRIPQIPTVLLVLTETGEKAPAPEELFSRLKKNLSFPLLLYKNLLYPGIAGYNADTMGGAMGILEYYFTLFYRVLEGAVFFVHYSQRSNPETDYIFTYLAKKIIADFSAGSAVVALDKYSFFAFCRPSDFAALRDLLADYNRHSGLPFRFVSWSYHQGLTFNIALLEYLKTKM